MLGGAVFHALVAAASTPTADCLVLMVSKRTGEAIYADDAIVGTCAAIKGDKQVRYNVRHRQVEARIDLAEGVNLGRIYLPKRPAVAAGAPVRITASVRHVVITRTVVAMESARLGQPFYVRAADGSIFVAPAVNDFPSDEGSQQ